MQQTEGKFTPALPFIGYDLLYNGVLHVAICREEIGVGIIKALHQDYLFASLSSLIGPILWLQLQSAGCCPNPHCRIAVVIRQRPHLTLADCCDYPPKPLYNPRLGLPSWSPFGPCIYFLFLPCIKKLLDFWMFFLDANCSSCSILAISHYAYNSGLVNLCCTVKNKHPQHSLLI
jgi:hypothetical protein